MDSKATPGLAASQTTVERCFKCFVEFGWFKRKHVCRRCNRLFCDACSSNRMVLQHGREACRVCDYCALEVYGGLAKFPALAPASRAATFDSSMLRAPPPQQPSFQAIPQASPKYQNYSPPMVQKPGPAGADSPAPPSISSILAAQPSSILRDLSPIQSAFKIPEELLAQLARAGFDRASVTQLHHNLSQRGVASDDINFILKNFFMSWKPTQPAPLQQSQLSDSLLSESANQASSSSSNSLRPEGSSDSAVAQLKAEISELKARVHEAEAAKLEIEKQMQVVETQVLGGFSFETWRKVQQMAAEQEKVSECVVCLDADAAVVASCGCKCVCKGCYQALPVKPNGYKSCPNCSKPIR